MTNAKNTVLGIDPGIGNTGWAIVKHTAGKYQYVDSGVILTRAHAPIGKRLDTHYTLIRQLMTEHSPDLVSIEAIFFNRNISSCISTASVIAIMELAAQHACVSTLQINPQAVKSAVTGNGSARKSDVRAFVNRLLNTEIMRDHEADASAAAIAGLLQTDDIFRARSTHQTGKNRILDKQRHVQVTS